MKNYKMIVPIVLIALYVLSVYMMYDSKATAQREYEQTLTAAREYREQDIQVDAEDNYKRALNMKPSLELALEIGEYYLACDQKGKASDWGNTIIKNYPKEAAGYEFLMAIYYEREDYVACFDLHDTFQKRQLASKQIEETMKSIEYKYFFNGEYSEVGAFSSGLCPVLQKDLWGYVNASGGKVIGSQFVKAGYHVELAPVVDGDNKAYFIDMQGNKKKVLTELKNIKELGLYNGTVFSAYDGKSWGFYDSDEKLISGGYEEVSAMGNGIAAVKKSGKWSFINQNGEAVAGKNYNNVIMDEKKVVSRNERLFVYNNGSYNMIDVDGKVIAKGYSDAKLFNDQTYAAVKKNGKWGFIDKDGKMIIEPQYQDARSFSNGAAAVQSGGRWGFINLEGKTIIEPQFDETKDFTSSGSVFVKTGEYWQLLRLYKLNH